MDKKVQTHIPYGFVIGLAMVVVSALLEVTKLAEKPGMQWIGAIIFLVGIILEVQAYSKANNAQITFGNAFGSGFKASAIVAIVMIAWGFISLLIFPQIFTRALEKAQTDMATKKMSEEQIDMAINFTKKYFKLLMVVGALFSTLFMGAIASLIAAAVAKKAPKSTLMNQ
ncbi:MAG: DUF4199 domain-containing protein [Chitinophagaceae bacterium]